MDCSGAVGCDGVWDAGGFECGLDLSKDGAWIFSERIVAGSYHELASLTCGIAHLGTLCAVAVVSAAEVGDDATEIRGDKLAGEGGEIVESIIGVRVVHDDGEGLSC